MNEQSATSRYVDIAVGGKLMWIGIKNKPKFLAKETK